MHAFSRPDVENSPFKVGLPKGQTPCKCQQFAVKVIQIHFQPNGTSTFRIHNKPRLNPEQGTLKTIDSVCLRV